MTDDLQFQQEYQQWERETFVCPYCGAEHQPNGVDFTGESSNAACCGEVGHCYRKGGKYDPETA